MVTCSKFFWKNFEMKPDTTFTNLMSLLPYKIGLAFQEVFLHTATAFGHQTESIHKKLTVKANFQMLGKSNTIDDFTELLIIS